MRVFVGMKGTYRISGVYARIYMSRASVQIDTLAVLRMVFHPLVPFSIIFDLTAIVESLPCIIAHWELSACGLLADSPERVFRRSFGAKCSSSTMGACPL